MKNKPVILVLVIAFAALAAKLYCAATTLGTSDVMFFASFGQYISKEGVVSIYTHNPLFNHPPLLGNYLGLVWDWAHHKPLRFAFLLRLPGILADLAIVLLFLWIRLRTGRPPWWALCLLAASPVCFMISGYHGNFDPLIPLGLVLTVVACMQRRALHAGILLGLACQVKIIPLIMSPALFFFWLHRKQATPFTLATIGMLLLGWCGPLLAIPAIFTHRVLVYNSIWGWWGFTYLFNISGIPGLAGMASLKPLTPAQTIVVQVLKLLVIAGALVVAWRRRRGSAEEILGTMGLVWTLFFTFAPGFGVQYLIWAGPFLMFYSPRWFAAFTAAASVALFIFYQTLSQRMPWFQAYGVERLFDSWAPWLLLPWAVFLALLIVSRREFVALSTRSNAAAPETQSADSDSPPVERPILSA